MTAKQFPTGRPETMSVAYKLARFQVGRNPRRRQVYVACRTAPVAALAIVFVSALLGTTGIVAAVAILRFVFTLTR